MGRDNDEAIAALSRALLEAQAARAAAEDAVLLYRRLLDEAPVSLLLFDDEGHLLDANQAAVDLLGYAPAELSAFPVGTLTGLGGQAVWPLLQANGHWSGEMPGRRKDGTTLSVAIQAKQLVLPSRTVYAALLRDVTEQRRAEAALRESEERSRSVIAALEEGVVLQTHAGTIAACNASAERILGLPADQIVGRSSLDPRWRAIHEDGSPFPGETHPAMVSLRTGQACSNVVMGVHRPDGALTWLSINSQPLTRPGEPQPYAVVASFTEISQRKQVEEQLRQVNARLTASVEELERRTQEMGRLAELGDRIHRSRSASEAYAVVRQGAPRLFPEASGTLYRLSQPSQRLVPVVAWGQAPADGTSFATTECRALRRGRVHAVVSRHGGPRCAHLGALAAGDILCVPLTTQGETLGLLQLGSPEPAPPASGEERQRQIEARQGLALTLADQLALALMNLHLRDSLRQQAIRDPLTGLFNRRYLEEALERELRRAARKRRSLGLILADLDHFKRVNDTLGHEVGDRLLRQVGAWLQQGMRREDLACRYGGDEFLLILPETTLATSFERAEQMRAQIKRLSAAPEFATLGTITLSLGVAGFPEHGALAAELLRVADRALYRAKATGRDQVKLGEPRADFPEAR